MASSELKHYHQKRVALYVIDNRHLFIMFFFECATIPIKVTGKTTPKAKSS